jgi:hypothetical protein
LKKRLGNRLGLGNNIALLGLCSELSFCLVTVSLSLAILLEGILHRNLLTQNVLPVQIRNSSITALKVGKADKSKALARARLLPCDLWQTQQRTEAAEGVIEDLLVDHRIEVSNEQLGANLGSALLIGAGLVDAQGFAVQLDPVHHVGGVLGVGGRAELDEAEALVRLGDAVARHVDVVDGSHLQHYLVYHCGGCALVDVSDVDGRLLVLFPETS